MTLQGNMLCRLMMLLSLNTELHSSASSPDPKVHMLSPEKYSCLPTPCQSTLNVATCKNKRMLPGELLSVRLLSLTKGQNSKLAPTVQLKNMSCFGTTKMRCFF